MSIHGMACSEWMLRQEAMKLGREIAVGLSRAGLLWGQLSACEATRAARIVVQFLW